MEKLGVVLDEEKTKTSSTERRCPSCGAEVKGPYCDNCGTKPFEKQPEPKK